MRKQIKSIATSAVFLLMPHASCLALPLDDDPYLWLEDVTADKSMAWVKERNAESVPELESKPEFKELHPRLVDIYNSRERIPVVQKRGPWLYNFWQDAAHPRGLWRRAKARRGSGDIPGRGTWRP